MPKSKSIPTEILQMKITLRDSRPPIWRRVLVADTTTLHQLHDIIQITMGWDDSHLHQFIVGERPYTLPEFELDYLGDEAGNEKQTRLNELDLAPKRKFVYEYDFGDGWSHEVLIEKILSVDESAKYPVCVTGKRACPPEDCGGVLGYENLLEAISDPQHPEHEDMIEWTNGAIDPERFDTEEANEALRHHFR